MTDTPTCEHPGCGKPLSDRRVTLIKPNGTDGRSFGPYCDEATDELLRQLIPAYSDGRPAYRITRETP